MSPLNPFDGVATINQRMELIAQLGWLPLAVEAETPALPAIADSDETLMLRYRDGDDGAFRALYSRYRLPLMRFSRHLVADCDAEEVFQETWIAVVNGRLRYSVRARFATWLFSIAHRRAADRHRSRARHPTQPWIESAAQIENTPSDTVQPSVQVAEDARERALREAIAALPFAQREVFLLRAETGLGLRDIARITHAPPETTKSRLRYALRELRKAMAPWT